MKIKNLWFIPLLVILGSCSSNNENYYKYSIANEEVTIVRLSDNAKSNLTSFTIPSYIEGYPVTKIASDAFEGSNLKSITFLEDSNIKEISQRAFANNEYLTSISFPSSLQALGVDSFCSCPNLANVDFSSANNLVYIADSSFYEDISLKEITLPESLISLGEEAFYGCKNLTKVTFLGNVKEIEKFAFDGCSSCSIYFNGNDYDDSLFDSQWNYDNSTSSFLNYQVANA